MRYQIRDENYGRALIEAGSAREALYKFFANEMEGTLRPLISEHEEDAEVTYAGQYFKAVKA